MKATYKAKRYLLCGWNAKSLAWLTYAGGVQIATRTELHEQARVMGGVKVCIQSGEKGMIKHTQNLLLHLSSLQLVPHGKRFSVHHFHGVEALFQPHSKGVPNLAEVDVADVAAAESPEEAEVVEAELAVKVAAEAGDGLPCGLVGLVGLGMGAGEERGGGGGVCGGGGRNGDGAAAAAAAEAEVAHPAPAGFRHGGDGGAATVIIGFVSGYGGGGGHGSVWASHWVGVCVCG